MKITLNLSVAPSAHERYALAGALPVALLGLVVLVWLSLSALHSYRDYRKAHRALLEVQAAEARLRTRETALKGELEQPGSQQVYRGVRFVNALIDQKRFSLAELTEQVTKLLPPQVRLAGMALAAGGNEPVVRFTIVGNSEEAVEKFLINLEDSSYFRYVAIINQGFEQEGSAGGPVRIACTAQYQGARRN